MRMEREDSMVLLKEGLLLGTSILLVQKKVFIIISRFTSHYFFDLILY